MPSAEYNKTEIAEFGIKQAIEKKEILTGLAEIAAFLDCSIGTVRNLIRSNVGFPAITFCHHGQVRSTKTLINRWQLKLLLTDLDHRDEIIQTLVA